MRRNGKKFASRVISLLLVLFLVVGIAPITKLPVEAADNDGLVVSKEATLEDDGTYTINLEAYATGTVKVTTTSSTPTDIVLVLDVSGSMAEPMDGTIVTTTVADQSKPAGYYGCTVNGVYCLARHDGSRWQYSQFYYENWQNLSSGNLYVTRMGALMDATGVFLDATAASNSSIEDNVTAHKVSIVKFAGTSTNDIGDNMYWYMPNFLEYNNTQIMQDLIEITDENVDSMKGVINGVYPGGPTAADWGLSHAKTVLSNSENGRNKAVVFFTDGAPNHGNDWDGTVANNAIAIAKDLKESGASIYSVGVFSDTDSVDTNINNFMNAVSSNYPEAEAYNNLNTGADNGYYMVADNAAELSDMFGEISSSISGSTTVTLDGNSVLKDVLGENFELPENFSNSNITVHTETHSKSGFTKDSSLDSNITATFDKTTESISVTGFNYKNHYVVESGEYPAGQVGKKLVVTITGIEADPDNFTYGTNVSTNAATSGIYATANDETPAKAFQQPLTQFASEVYVLDYAKPVTVSADDWAISGLTNLDIDGMDKFTTGVKTLGNLTYGTASWDDSNSEVTYTPQSTNWNGSDSFYAFGEWKTTPTGVTTGDNAWAKVSFIPASNVYYEDDFVTNATTGTVGITYGDGWSIVYDGKTSAGAADDNTETVNGNIHGWETSLSDDTQFSDGSAHTSSTATATAYFTFTGTGVDIYSYTDMESGLVTAALNKLDENGDVISGQTKYLMVDNLAVSNGTNGYYQIPTLSFQDLEYGTYKLGLVVNRGKAVETDDNGNPVTDADGNLVYKTDVYRSTYYLDGIRVYNPLGTTVNGEAADAYGQNSGIDADTIKTVYKAVNTLLAASEITGNAVFTDLTEDGRVAAADYYDSAVYAKYGPKNEVYLAAGQSITFAVESDEVNYYVGLKSLKGSEVSVNAAFSNGESQSVATISHSTDLYYKVVPTPGEDGKYYITVSNTSDASTDSILAVTKLQLVGSGDLATTAFSLRTISEDEAVSYAVAFAAMDEIEYSEEPVEPELPDVEIPDEEPETPDVEIPDTEQPEETPSRIEQLVSFVNKLFNALNKWFGRR